MTQTISAAVVQATPVLFNKAECVAKARRLIAEASDKGAHLILFPEAFIPAYPRGLTFGVTVGDRDPRGRDLYLRYWSESIAVPGPETKALGEAARHAGAYVAIGVTERDGAPGAGTLYCTLLYFGPDGRLLGKHRKLKPTAAERYIWGEGDGCTLDAIETPFGILGGLICWENYMPLARTAMYEQGVTLYLAPTADARDGWQATLQHIALEGRCFVLGCNQYVKRADYPSDMHHLLDTQPEVMCRGGSAIISPFGEVLAGPEYRGESTLYAKLDPDDIVRARFDFDPVGHYARPDVFHLKVNRGVTTPVRTTRHKIGDNG